MQPGSALALSGNELKTALDLSALSAPGDLGTGTKDATAQTRPTELLSVDHTEGTGLLVEPTSTVIFRYIVRRVRDNAIVQRNDNRSYPVRRSCTFNAHR